MLGLIWPREVGTFVLFLDVREIPNALRKASIQTKKKKKKQTVYKIVNFYSMYPRVLFRLIAQVKDEFCKVKHFRSLPKKVFLKIKHNLGSL